MLYMVMVVPEFNGILLKASGKTFEFIQADFNKKLCITDEKSDEFKAWKEKLKLEAGDKELPRNWLLLNIST